MVYINIKLNISKWDKAFYLPMWHYFYIFSISCDDDSYHSFVYLSYITRKQSLSPMDSNFPKDLTSIYIADVPMYCFLILNTLDWFLKPNHRDQWWRQRCKLDTKLIHGHQLWISPHKVQWFSMTTDHLSFYVWVHVVSTSKCSYFP